LPSIDDLRLRDFVDKVKGSLDTFITDRHTRTQSFIVSLAVELQQVQRVCAGDSDKIARSGPRDLIEVDTKLALLRISPRTECTHASCIDLDPPDQFTRLPIPEEHIPAPPRSKQSTAMDPLNGDPGGTALDQTGPLLEVSVDSNLVL
jgi:hypothetical protein